MGLVDRRSPRLFIQAKCSSCQKLALVASEYETIEGEPRQFRLILTLLWPRSIRPSKAPSTLPEIIRKSYDEARAIIADSPQAAAVLVRRCLQHVIHDRLNIQEKDLFREIQEAVKVPDLTSSTKACLDHIRKIGNWSAHPSFDAASSIIDVSLEEAHYTLDVLEMLFQDLYVTPDMVKKMTASLAARK